MARFRSVHEKASSYIKKEKFFYFEDSLIFIEQKLTEQNDMIDEIE